MISSYRLGDLVLLSLSQNEKNELVNDYPDTIGSKYILYKNINNKTNIDIIAEIALEYMEKYLSKLPNDIKLSNVIHLRLGDVVKGSEWHEKVKRPFEIEYYEKIVPKNRKIYIIGKCFFAKPSSKNYDDCIEASNIYLKNMLEYFNADYFDGGSADIDLCCALACKCFIQGRGFYSKLIVEIRKKLNLECIETSVHDPF